MDKKDNIILAFESSCDETSVAVVKNGNEILQNIVAIEVARHQRLGGLVTEVAQRDKIETLTYRIQETLDEVSQDYNDMEQIAVMHSIGVGGDV